MTEKKEQIRNNKDIPLGYLILNIIILVATLILETIGINSSPYSIYLGYIALIVTVISWFWFLITILFIIYLLTNRYKISKSILPIGIVLFYLLGHYTLMTYQSSMVEFLLMLWYISILLLIGYNIYLFFDRGKKE